MVCRIQPNPVVEELWRLLVPLPLEVDLSPDRRYRLVYSFGAGTHGGLACELRAANGAVVWQQEFACTEDAERMWRDGVAVEVGSEAAEVFARIAANAGAVRVRGPHSRLLRHSS